MKLNDVVLKLLNKTSKSEGAEYLNALSLTSVCVWYSPSQKVMIYEQRQILPSITRQQKIVDPSRTNLSHDPLCFGDKADKLAIWEAELQVQPLK